MSTRPEILFGLFGALSGLAGIGPKTAKLFENLNVFTPRDLVFLLPQSGVDRRPRESIRDYAPGQVATVAVEVGAHLPPRQRRRPYRVLVRDSRQEFQIIYFHLAPEQIQRLLPTGQRRLVSGRFDIFDGIAQMAHPDHVLRPDEAVALGAFEPVYPLSAGLGQRHLRKAVAAAMARLPDLAEWIDPHLRAARGWPAWREALVSAHAPERTEDLAASAPGRERLAYDEFLAHQLMLALLRQGNRRKPGLGSQGDGRLVNAVLARLPYAPTSAQRRAMAEICADMAAPRRMNRLLQGDVGSGKTLVALVSMLTAIEAGGQAALMAPTEILARQHHQAIAPMLAGLDMDPLLLTGRDKGAERDAKLRALAVGRARLVIGTHALFQRDVAFADLRLAVIDEQHRFGVEQRLALGEKGDRTDILVMTATPIPRSLALVHYGDMDLSLLDEKPPGRQPVVTSLVSSERLEDVIEHLARALAAGRQAYWVCPLVEESEAITLTAAQSRYEVLRARLGDQVGLVHGQLTPAEKDGAMARFVQGETRLLVATTVIEVGVNVPNATIMVIERAETFGLAQLHQLRGRVGRGEGASTCLLIYDAPLGDIAARRLKLMRETEDGFRLSDEDLAMRGAGDMIGTAQSGLPRFRIADSERQTDLMAIAQRDARALLEVDPDLSSPRGKAARHLLWLMEQDKAIRLIHAG